MAEKKKRNTSGLRPFQKGLPDPEQRRVQRMGSVAGNAAKAEYKTFRELAREDISEEERREMIKKLASRSKYNNKALELLLKILGELEETKNVNLSVPVVFEGMDDVPD